MKNKRKITRILLMALLVALFIPSFSYGAGTIKLVKSYPADGAGGFEPVNMNVKLWFDKDVLDPSVQNINKNAFSIKTTSGEAIKFEVLYNANKGHISLLLKENLSSDSEYVVTIGKGLTATDKSRLGTDQTLTFKTRDVNKDMTSGMVLMFVMVAVMIGITSFQTKRQAEKQAKESKEKVNPYKVAKEKNTTVDKVIKDQKKNQNNTSKANKGAATSKGSAGNKETDPDKGKGTMPSKEATTNKSTTVNRSTTVNKGKASNIKKLNKK